MHSHKSDKDLWGGSKDMLQLWEPIKKIKIEV